MQHTERWIALVLIIAALTASACQDTSEEAAASKNEPAKIEPVGGTDLNRITLTAEAAKRLDIQTAPVRGAEGGTTVIPYSAVIYDPDGETWTYTSPEPLTFVRHSIAIDRIEGDQAFLSDGPQPGRAVVTVGAAELYGTELGVE
jgi:hypothetical protein